MTKLLAILFSACFFVSCGASSSTDNHDTKEKGDLLKIEAKSIESSNGWGYQVYVGEKLYIEQPFIPAINGTHSFASEEEALKTANMVVQKIKNHQPPRITKQELDSLGIKLPDSTTNK